MQANQTNAPRFHYMYEKNKLPSYHPEADKKGAPFACLITKIDWKERKIYYALSTANTNHDMFNKEVGRKTALARLANKPQTAYIGVNAEMIPESGHEITKLVMLHLSRTPSVPTRVRQGARRWLKFAEQPKTESTVMEEEAPTIPAPPRMPNVEVPLFDPAPSKLPAA